MNDQSLPLMDGPITFAGAVALEDREEGVRPWRLDFDRIELYEPTLRERAACPAGVRVTTISDTEALTLEIAPHEGAAVYDLLIDGADRRRVVVEPGQTQVRFAGLPAGSHRLEVYLPQMAPTTVADILIDEGASATAFDDTRPKWTVYGSSITQCAAAAGPSETWPALVANRFDLNLTCLGYSGNCHLEPMVAKLIRDLPADYISLCVGINVQGGGSMSPRTFRAAVIGLIDTIREKHATTPIVVVSPICSPPRECTPNAVGMTLELMREDIAEAIDILRKYGDAHLAYQDGIDVFGPEHVHHMPDQLHPDAEGYRALAQRYGDVVMPKLGLGVPTGAAADA